jgi:hypothetical protein
MPLTYEPIATTTLGSASSTITFSSIPSSYTDLRISFVARASANYIRFRLRFNGDTGNNYDFMYLVGTRSNAVASISSGLPYIQADLDGTIIAQPSFYLLDIFSYLGSNKKTCLISSNEDKDSTGRVSVIGSLWNSTSAITSITIYSDTSTFATGTIATLYGIKAA